MYDLAIYDVLFIKKRAKVRLFLHICKKRIKNYKLKIKNLQKKHPRGCVWLSAEGKTAAREALLAGLAVIGREGIREFDTDIEKRTLAH